ADAVLLPQRPGVVAVLSPVLDRLLRDRGYAESHCHIGAALDFPTLWVSALRALATPGIGEKAFHSPGAGLREGDGLAPWLVRAAAARYVLAAYLAWGSSAGPFEDYLETEVRPRVAGHAGTEDYQLLVAGLAGLGRGDALADGFDVADWSALYARL